MKNVVLLFLICVLILTEKAFTGDQMRPQKPNIGEMLGPNPFVISPEKVKEILICHDLEIEEFLQQLVPIASTFAKPLISSYNVGVALLGKSGTIYLGINLEFPGVPLNEAVHGEQFAIAHARVCGEEELVMIALSAAPCGHCRQFMHELGKKEPKVLICDSSPQNLSSLLPYAFGPEDLGLEGDLLQKRNGESSEISLFEKAHHALIASYAPYTHAKSGVAIETKEGKMYEGSYLENVAFNPSLSPLQSALISLVADLGDYKDIQEVLLLEYTSAVISQEMTARELLKNIAPQAVFRVEKMNKIGF